jgi:micrococcal nuclease
VLDVTFAATCVFARIFDCDTFLCGEERVRMLLIDASELGQGPYDASAQEALNQLIPAGTQVGLGTDVQERDRYGRLLAYAYGHDGELLNAEMIRQDYAVVGVYPPNVKYVERFPAVQGEAQSARGGLWSGSALECMPADHRAGRCER